jgi:hypothetical protein
MFHVVPEINELGFPEGSQERMLALFRSRGTQTAAGIEAVTMHLKDCIGSKLPVPVAQSTSALNY